MTPESKQSFGRNLGKLRNILKHCGVSFKELDWEADCSVEIELDNEVIIQVYIPVEGQPAFYEIGEIVQSGGSYWEPPDIDFVARCTTTRLWEAAEEILLLPKRWEIQRQLEDYDIKEHLNENIYEG